MNTLIVGYGSMGKEIEQVLIQRGHTVTAKIDPVAEGADAKELTPAIANGADSAIEFSLAEAVEGNAKFYATHGLKAIIGTTGWTERLNAVRKLFADGGACLYGTNFSIGAHIFFHLVEKAAAAVSNLPQYDVMMYEIHHSNKKDSPSGTALSVADLIIKNHSGKNRIVTERLDRRPEPDELHVGSVRGGSVPGVHTVMLDSLADTVEVKHTARGRSGLALGAVMGLEWLEGRQGFFDVTQFMEDLLQKGDTHDL